MKIILTLGLLLLWASARSEPTITYDVFADVTKYGTSEPVVEGYHLLVFVKDLEVLSDGSKAVLVDKMFHWKFVNYEEGLQTREALLKLKTLVGADHQKPIEQISEIVRELTNGTKPDNLE